LITGTTSSPEISNKKNKTKEFEWLLPRWLAGHEWSANDPDIKSFWTSTITSALTGFTA
jgi:hypothetical protein